MWPHPTPENHDFDKLEYILHVYEIVLVKLQVYGLFVWEDGRRRFFEEFSLYFRCKIWHPGVASPTPWDHDLNQHQEDDSSYSVPYPRGSWYTSLNLRHESSPPEDAFKQVTTFLVKCFFREEDFRKLPTHF